MGGSIQANEDAACCYRAIEGAGMRVMWEITSRCNMRCRHCFATPSHERDLPLSTVLDILRSMADAGVRKVAITGGEPLMRDDTLRILSHIAELGMLPKLLTNGVLIDRAVAEHLAAIDGIEVSVSIDGATAKTHDTIRCCRGAFDRVMQSLRLLAEYPAVQLNATCVVTSLNQGELLQIVEIARSCSAQSVNFSALLDVAGVDLPHIRAYRTRCPLSADATTEVLRGAAEARARYSDIAVRTIGLRSGDRVSCPAGHTVAYVDPQGGIHPCSLGRLARPSSLLAMSFEAALASLTPSGSVPWEVCR